MPFAILLSTCIRRTLTMTMAFGLFSPGFLPNARAVTELPKVLQAGFPQKGIQAATDEGIVFKIVVPEGAQDLVFRSSGGSGDCDLYVRHGSHPSLDGDNAGESSYGGTAEEVSIAKPEAGPWYVLAYAASAFKAVTLTARYTRAANVTAVPQVFPQPGIYSERVDVSLRCRVAKSVLRYTLDGSDPSESSPIYHKPLVLTTATSVRVRAYALGKTPGPVVQADYGVTPANTVTELTSGNALHHLAGSRSLGALFKIVVPPGQLRLDFLTEGGTGNSRISVRQGAPPTSKFYTRSANGMRNEAQISIANPAPGDWFVWVRASSVFSNCSLMASFIGTKPDLAMWASTLEPYLSVENFKAGECEVEEGMLTAGTHTLLRFSTESRNVGGSDLVMPSIFNADGSLNPLFEYHACHGHYHFLGFAAYRLLNAKNEPVATGRKVSFCLEDVQAWSATAPADPRFDCDSQGIQAGWADVYDAGLPGQWIDVSGLPPGSYTLEVTLNPDHVIEEDNYSNNTVSVPVEIE